MMDKNYCEAINNCAASDNAYKFMSTVKDTPAYWQHIISDVLVMVKQLGIHTYFMTLSCADFHWNELVLIIRKLKERTGDSAPKLTEDSKEQYIDSVISTIFPSDNDNLLLGKLVKKYQFTHHPRIVESITKMNVDLDVTRFYVNVLFLLNSCLKIFLKLKNTF